MKGPHQRLKFDLRRLWECPVCNRRELAPGSVTSRFCTCQMKQAEGKPVVMKLIEDGPRRLVPAIVPRQCVTEHQPAVSAPAIEAAEPPPPSPTDPPPHAN